MKNSKLVLKPLIVAALLFAGSAQAETVLGSVGKGDIGGALNNTVKTLNGTLKGIGLAPSNGGSSGDLLGNSGLGNLSDLTDSLNSGSGGNPNNSLAGLEDVDRMLRGEEFRDSLEALQADRDQRGEDLLEALNTRDERNAEFLEALDLRNERNTQFLEGLAAADAERMLRLNELASNSNNSRSSNSGQSSSVTRSNERDSSDDDNGFLGVNDSSTLGTENGPDTDRDSGFLGAGDSSTLGTDRTSTGNDSGFLGAGNSSTLGTD